MSRLVSACLILSSIVTAAHCAAQPPVSDAARVSDAEKAAAAALDVTYKADWKPYADLVHPDSLDEFRDLLKPLLEDARSKTEAEQAVLLQFFEGGDDLETVLSWSPNEFFVRFMKRAGAGQGAPDRQSSVRIVGTVPEGADQAHTVARVTLTAPNGSEVESVTVVSLKMSDGKWKIVPTEWKELAGALRMTLGGIGDQGAVGEPTPARPDP